MKLSQKQRVLAVLRHGSCTQVDWLAPQVIDSGPPITRLAARINELRDDGFDIREAGRRHGCSIYVLALKERADVVVPESPATTLFEPSTGRRPLSHYESEAA
jgi:hypothetical protein